MQSFPKTETTFLLPGPTGELEVLTTFSEENTTPVRVGIVCHPHPLHGGTMNNKVVTTLSRTLRELGLHTVRFNFRGVGKSAGVFDHGQGELKDLLAIVDWVKQVYPDAIIWLAGFSFGSFVAIKAATQLNVERLIAIAPPVSHFDLQHLPEIPCPWIVVQGEQDEVISAEAVFEWVEQVHQKPILIRMPDAGHFFHGKLLELREALITALQSLPNR